MATKKKASLEALIFSWGSAAGLAALVFVLLIVLGGWGFIQAIWMAAVVFVAVGGFNYLIFARPTPPLAGSFPQEMAVATGRAMPASVKAGPAAAPAPTDPTPTDLAEPKAAGDSPKT
ncbi:MAG: hypothetical protein ACXIU8_16575 [Alkalilacustris sp.]